MKPWITLAREPSPDGKELVLQERDGVYVIRVGGRELMSSARHGSEEAMAQAGLLGLGSPEPPSVLIGGLGLGYTLRAALDRLPAGAGVTVVEISAAVVAWNRGPLAPLAGSPLSDPRVTVELAEVGQFLATTRRRFDAILLDVDNGPSALSCEGNRELYGPAGLAACSRALRPGGALVVWSAGAAPRFVARLREAGFDAHEERVAARSGGGKARHVLFVGRAGRRPRP
jgi:spermidine synthase